MSSDKPVTPAHLDDLHGRVAALEQQLQYGSQGATGEDLLAGTVRTGDFIWTAQAEKVARQRKDALVCDGSPADLQTYANLHRSIGDVWDGGRGSPPAGFFWLPDLRGLTPMGAYVVGLNSHVLTPSDLAQLDPGDRIGTESTVLGANNIAPHTHTYVPAVHTTGAGTTDTGTGVPPHNSLASNGWDVLTTNPNRSTAADPISNRTPSIAGIFLIKT